MSDIWIKNCSVFNILIKVYSEIIYEPINVGLTVKIWNLKNFNTRQLRVVKDCCTYQLDVPFYTRMDENLKHF